MLCGSSKKATAYIAHVYALTLEMHVKQTCIATTLTVVYTYNFGSLLLGEKQSSH